MKNIIVLLCCVLWLTACGSSNSVGNSTYTLSGTITHGGSALSGATVTLSGSATGTTTTDANGNYSFSVANGSYTVTPSLINYTFSPPSTSVTISNADSTGNNFTSTTSTSIQLLTNNSFESGLTGWLTDTYLDAGAAGTCSFNADTAPGTETLTSLAGFPATDGTKIALGSVSSTSGNNPVISCVLYQDVVIPAGATTATFSLDIGAKGSVNGTNNGYKIGIYSSASVPGWYSPTLTGSTVTNFAAVAETTLQSKALSASFDISSFAGQTVRFAIINAVQYNTGQVIGIDNVQFTVTAVN